MMYVSMTSLMTWLMLSVLLMAVTEGRKREGGWSGATLFPPPKERLSAVVQNLVTRVKEMTDKQSRDWSRLRRVERRGKSARHDIDVMHGDIIQLRHHVIEINSRLSRLDDLTSDLQLEVTRMNHDHNKLREEVGKVKHSRSAVDDALTGLRTNVTLIESWRTSAQGRLDQLQGWSQGLQKSQHDVLTALHNLQATTRPSHTGSKTGPPPTSTDYQVSKKDQDSQQRSSEAFPVLKEAKEGVDFQNRPQGDQSAGVREEGLTTLTPVKGGQYDVNMSGDGEPGQDAGSGEGDEFFILEEPHPQDKAQGEEGEARVVTPTPLTTSTVPTLTHPSLTLPTSPLPNCPSLSDFSLLQQRVDALDEQLQTSLPGENLLRHLNNRTEQLEAAATERGRQLERVESEVGEVGARTSLLTRQLGSLGLSEFMDRLQGSLVNFTTGVMTLDQWHTASQQMLNATDRTQRRLTELGSRVTDNAQMTSDLQLTLEEQRALSQSQYRTLQTNVIRLNNSLQDLMDHVHSLPSSKTQTERPIHVPHSGSSSKQSQQGLAMMSRVDDLALQLVYSDNRLSHLETQVLNASLNSCRKTNSDLYQDASLIRVDKQLTQAQRDLVTLKDTVKRLDLGLYRLHGNSKSTHEALRKVKGQVNDVMRVAGTVEALRSEVDNMLFQMPVDCDDYYQRGYRQSGEFVIYPRGAAHSLKVHCLMQLNDDDDPGRRRKGGDGGERGRRGERPWMEAGGWTVIHQRSSGKVNFTRSWAEYAVGFGTPRSEYWLGNEHLHLLTQHRNYTLLITLTDIFGGHWHATYRPFALSSKEDNYRLRLGRYQGNATDTLRYASGMTFSTYDRDTDVSSSPCARYNGGGWWYSHCQTSNLNGPYEAGMIWFHRDWRDWLQLRQATMMVRPVS